MAARKKKTEEEKEPNVRISRFLENLPVTLTDEQVAGRANRAAHLLNDRDHLEEELKAYTKTEKSKIAKVESEMRHLSDEVRTKTTYQDVKCERRFNYDTGMVQEVRTDTGEVLQERELNDKEKQRDLGFDGDGELDGEFADAPQDDPSAPGDDKEDAAE